MTKNLSKKLFKKVQLVKHSYEDRFVYFAMHYEDQSKNIYVPWNRNDEIVKSSINIVCNVILSSPQDWRKDIVVLPLFQVNNLNTMDRKMIRHIANLLAEINAFNIKYRKSMSFMSPSSAIQLQKYQNAINVYKTSISILSNELPKLIQMRNNGIQCYATWIDSANLDFYSENDLTIVRAFEFIGSKVEKQVINGVEKWVCTGANDNGMEYVSSQNGTILHFSLPIENVNQFLDEYMGKPKTERQDFIITPKGIFDYYIQQLNQFGILSQTATSQMSSLNAQDKYNIESIVWKDFLLEDEKIAKLNATRLAMTDIFQENLNAQNELKSTDFSVDELVDDKSLVDIYNDCMSVKRVPLAQRYFEKGNVENIVNSYTYRIQELMKVPNAVSNGFSKTIANLSKARYEMLELSKIQKEIYKTILDAPEQSEFRLNDPNMWQSECIRFFGKMGDMSFVSLEEGDE